MKVLFDQQDGESLLLQGTNGAADLLNDHRRKALGRFVEQQQLGAGAQNATDRQHLLLASGQFGALAVEALANVGKQLEDTRKSEAAGFDLGRQQQVLLDIETGKNATLLRTQCNAGASDHIR